MVKKKDLTQEDKNAWENYIKDPSDVYDKDKPSTQSSNQKDRFKFDLHGYNLDSANNKVKDLILHCFKNKYKEILLITGKGLHSNNEKNIYASKDLSKLKYSVPEFIKSDNELSKLIISINEAKIDEGGEGAIIIKLKKFIK